MLLHTLIAGTHIDDTLKGGITACNLYFEAMECCTSVVVKKSPVEKGHDKILT